MLSLLRRGSCWFGNGPVRRQNFFELNPIFPDAGQKDFDIYNVDYNHILSGDLAVKNEERYQQLKQKLTKDVYLGPILNRRTNSQGDHEIDDETGFPVGIHEDFDAFIEIFKREKKVGSNVVGEFEGLVMQLMEKLKVKSELELIKMFRLNLANSTQNSLQLKLRALLFNAAFFRFLQSARAHPLHADHHLQLSQLLPFLDTAQPLPKGTAPNISKQELEEIAFRSSLKELDEKIANIQQQLFKQALSNGSFVPEFHPTYGQAIREEEQTNLKFDLNHPRGYAHQLTTTEQGYTSDEAQDRFIESRINKFFFLQALKHVQAKEEFSEEHVKLLHQLPVHVRSKDKIINSLLHRYKEHELLLQPDLEDIYAEIDIALKKTIVKLVPNLLSNHHHNQHAPAAPTASPSQHKERVISKELLLWERLDVEEIFDPDNYEQEQVDRVKLNENEIAELSPSAVLELSLNKMPMNLFRHEDLDNFAVFNKYRKRIYKDYITDRTIDPEIEFKYFSLEEAHSTLRKVKKAPEVTDKYYGHATRKSGEAEVYLTRGTGKVTINNEPLADYLGDVYHRGETLKPFIFTETAGQFDAEFHVVGGGIHSQAECMAMALTKALIMVNPRYEKILSRFGLTGADDRKNESKKIGLYTARVRPPYVRR